MCHCFEEVLGERNISKSLRLFPTFFFHLIIFTLFLTFDDPIIETLKLIIIKLKEMKISPTHFILQYWSHLLRVLRVPSGRENVLLNDPIETSLNIFLPCLELLSLSLCLDRLKNRKDSLFLKCFVSAEIVLNFKDG